MIKRGFSITKLILGVVLMLPSLSIARMERFATTFKSLSSKVVSKIKSYKLPTKKTLVAAAGLTAASVYAMPDSGLRILQGNPLSKHTKSQLSEERTNKWFRYDSFADYLKESWFKWQPKRVWLAIVSRFFEVPLTQTEGLLYDSSIREQLTYMQYTELKESQNIDLITNIMKKERELLQEKTHPYVFTHATQSDKYLIAYFHTRLFEKLFESEVSHSLFLRQPCKYTIANDIKTAQKMREIYVRHGIGKDGDFNTQPVFSVNPSPLGGIGSPTESSFMFFVKRKTGGWFNDDGFSFKTFFENFGLSSMYARYERTIKNMNMPENVMLQCALTREAVEKASYSAIPNGAKARPFVYGISQDTLLPVMHNIKTPWQIQNESTRFSLAQNFQSRIVLTRDFLLDPLQRDQMKIYRYSTQEETLRKHEYAVDRMVDDLMLRLSLDQKNELKQKMLDFGLKQNYYQRTSMADEMKFLAKKAWYTVFPWKPS